MAVLPFIDVRCAHDAAAAREASGELCMMLYVIAVGEKQPAHSAVLLEPAEQVLARLWHIDQNPAFGAFDEVRQRSEVFRRWVSQYPDVVLQTPRPLPPWRPWVTGHRRLVNPNCRERARRRRSPGGEVFLSAPRLMHHRSERSLIVRIGQHGWSAGGLAGPVRLRHLCKKLWRKVAAAPGADASAAHVDATPVFHTGLRG